MSYLGEMQLLGWSESHNHGAKLTLALPDPDDLAPFRTMTVRKGKQAGQILAVLVVEMADGEEPSGALLRALEAANQKTSTETGEIGRVGDDRWPEVVWQPETERLKGGPLARLAGRFCGDNSFVEWVRPIYDRAMGGEGLGWGDVSPDEVGGKEVYARHAILVLCKVDSRRMLDHDPVAAELFHRLIRKPYSAHLSAHTHG